MKHQLTIAATIVFALLSVFCQTACNNKTDGIEIVPLEANEINSDEFAEKDTYISADSFDFGAGRGAVWNTWKTLHTECMKAQWANRSVYMGPSNQLGLGTLVDKKERLAGRLTALGIPEAEVQACFAEGAYTPCNIVKEMTLSMDMLLQGQLTIPQLDAPLNAELNTAISKHSVTTVSIDRWRINSLDPLLLRALLKRHEDLPLVQTFVKELRSGNMRLVIKEYEIEGFKANVSITKELSAELSAALRNASLARVNGDLTVNIDARNTQTLSLNSDSKCKVFIELGKLKVD